MKTCRHRRAIKSSAYTFSPASGSVCKSITIGERQFDLQLGEACDIARGQVHRLANRTDEAVEIIEVQFGDELSEDDIVRLQDDYERD
jgi:mannose-6-phosphate isomerase-like protein (cupin superfamily)